MHYPDSKKFVALKSQKRELLFCNALESEEKEILASQDRRMELVEELPHHDWHDIFNCGDTNGVYLYTDQRYRDLGYLHGIEHQRTKRIDTPTATYKIFGKQVEVFDKVKLDDGRSIFCSRSIFHDKNINQFHILRDTMNNTDGELYIHEDSMKSCSMYNADSLKYLGSIPADGTLKGFCSKEGYVYLYHQKNSDDGFDRISIAPENNLKKSSANGYQLRC